MRRLAALLLALAAVALPADPVAAQDTGAPVSQDEAPAPGPAGAPSVAAGPDIAAEDGNAETGAGGDASTATGAGDGGPSAADGQEGAASGPETADGEAAGTSVGAGDSGAGGPPAGGEAAEGGAAGPDAADAGGPVPDAGLTAGRGPIPATAGEGAASAILAATAQDSIDYQAWRQTADRAELLTSQRRGSDFALERLRADLVTWRDRFGAVEDRAAGRIATLAGQLAALGQRPEAAAEGEEPPPEAEAVAARRAAIEAELAQVRAPVQLARESYAHADGLIREIDRLIRARSTAALTERGPSPLDPRLWPAAAEVVADRIAALNAEFFAAATNPVRQREFVNRIPLVALSLALGALLLLRGRHWAQRIEARADVLSPRGEGVWRFAMSILTAALFIVGTLLIASGLRSTGLLGNRLALVVDMLPAAGLFVIVSRWLADQLFAQDAQDAQVQGVLAFDRRRRRRARRTVVLTGWLLFAVAMVTVGIIGVGETPRTVEAVLVFPMRLLLAYMLFRFGRLLVGAPWRETDAADDALHPYRQTTIRFAGRLAMLAAIGGPLLAAAGYYEAASALMLPVLLSLAAIGTLIVLQRLVHDIFGLIVGKGREGLAPVLIAFALVVASVPVFALIWGARREDLAELWTRLNEGYALGEARIAPLDLVWLVLIFAIGYVATRLVQSTLRSTILPRTRLDIGARNAIVAGLGYVGIFAAALIAIMSAGLDLSSLAIVAGALSVGIGFGLQTIVSNFVAGIILLIERPISEGDWIEVGGQMGYVRAISVRSTIIETFDRTDVIVPNADLVSGRVTNFTRGNSVGRAIVPVGVAHDSDPVRVEAILREVAEANPMVIMNPPPAVLFMAINESHLRFEIRAILRDVNFVLDVINEMNHAVARRFAEEGIEIAFPQRDLWLRNPETLGGRPSAPKPGPRAAMGGGRRRAPLHRDAPQEDVT